MRLVLLAGMILLTACGPDGRPKPSAAAQIVRDDSRAAAVWPALLQHCYRGPSCDPTSNFGQGTGQASGETEWVAWYVESKDVVKEGGQDYGAAINISIFGPRGIGGTAGRPLGLEEVENTLRGVNARRSRLWIEYRTPGGGEPEPYFLAFRSAEIAFQPEAALAAKSDKELADIAGAYLDTLKWENGETGVKVEIQTADDDRVVFTAYSSGMPSGAHSQPGLAMKRGYEPWVFYVSRNLRDEPAPELMRAIEQGKTLSMRVIQPDGGVMLEDGLYPKPFAGALATAKAALADPVLAQSFVERCAKVKDYNDSFWLDPNVSPATLSCDPRTTDQRRRNINEQRRN